MRKFSICHVVSEATPFAKTGGLADVSSGLCRYLGARGHDVRLFLPLYRRIREDDLPLTPLAGVEAASIGFGDREYDFEIATTPLPDSDDVLVHLVDCPALFDRESLYTDAEDEHLRFALLSRAAVETCQRLAWAPDVFHVNDWHTGLLPLYLRTVYGWDELLARSRTLLTIHNIGYQGVFSADTLAELGFAVERHNLDRSDLAGGVVNFLKTGLLHADALSTVSRTYAEEIQTPEFGMGLEGILRRRRADLTGIVNGVDYGDWNPEKDPLIPRSYSAADLSGKTAAKRDLLEDFGLPVDPAVPLFGIVSRLTGQKGFELLREILPPLLGRYPMQLVVLGTGERDLETWFQRLRDTFPDQVAVYRGYSNELAHRIEAGADLFLMPSRYEPCGLNQMYSLRYGTVPIVRRTGGLADTVEPFDPVTGSGTGFVFDAFEPRALLAALLEALSVWKMPTAWAQLVQNGMAQDFSWDRQGREYEELFDSMLAAAPVEAEPETVGGDEPAGDASPPRRPQP